MVFRGSGCQRDFISQQRDVKRRIESKFQIGIPLCCLWPDIEKGVESKIQIGIPLSVAYGAAKDWLTP